MQVMRVMQVEVPFAQSNQIGLAAWRRMWLAYAGNRECLHVQMLLQILQTPRYMHLQVIA